MARLWNSMGIRATDGRTSTLQLSVTTRLALQGTRRDALSMGRRSQLRYRAAAKFSVLRIEGATIPAGELQHIQPCSVLRAVVGRGRCGQRAIRPSDQAAAAAAFADCAQIHILERGVR